MTPKQASVLRELGRRAFSTPIKGSLAGLGLSALENATVMDTADPETKKMNLVLGGVTGLGMGGAHSPDVRFSRLAAWPMKEVGVQGYDKLQKFVNIQQPIAETNLETAMMNRDAARTAMEKAKHLSPQDIGSLITGLAAIGGTAGLGYYLYNKIGPGKKPAAPKVTIQLPKTHGTNGSSVEMEADPVSLSKNLYRSLARDAKRKLRQEARAGVEHEKPKSDHQDEEKEASLEVEDLPFGMKRVRKPKNWDAMSKEEQKAYNLKAAEAARAALVQKKASVVFGGILFPASTDRTSRLRRLVAFEKGI